jgi:hypothetical protein
VEIESLAAPLRVRLSDAPRTVSGWQGGDEEVSEMTEFSLGVPHSDELGDAIEALDDVLRLNDLGDVDLPPYLTRLLLQLEETLAIAPAQPSVTA